MSKLTNLYDETMRFCKPSDIDYVLISKDMYSKDSHDELIDKKWFLKQAKRIDYDASYGGDVIDLGLKIVLMDGSWLEREEYDGAEGWTLKTPPNCPAKSAPNDIAVILSSKHGCPFNNTTIDGQSISKSASNRDHYSIWHEKDGQIVVEQHEWVNGNYQEIDYDLMNL